MNTEKLLLELKSKLSITWEDEETNSRLGAIIADAQVALNHKLGCIIDYSIPGMEHNLFLNYCLYDWNNCTNEFDRNYMSDIYQIRAIYEVKYYEK